MKRFTLLFIIFLAFTVSGQENKILSKQDLIPYFFEKDSIEGLKAFITDNEELQFIKIINNTNLTKDQAYNRILLFFTYKYADGKSVIQIQDKDAGQIIGRGFYPDFATNMHSITSLLAVTTNTYTYSAYHILQCDIKDNRLRIILTVKDVELYMSQIPNPTYSSSGSITKNIGYLWPFQKSIVITDKKLKGLDKITNETYKGAEESDNIALKALGLKCKETIDGLIKTIGDSSSSTNTQAW